MTDAGHEVGMVDGHKPHYEDVEQTFIGLTKTKFVSLVVVLGFLGVFLLSTTLLLDHIRATRAAKENRQTVMQNRRAIVFICSTTGVLDAVVVGAGNQIEQSFKNGTYAKLRRQGVLTGSQVAAARATLAQYRRADVKLRQASFACAPIVGGRK